MIGPARDWAYRGNPSAPVRHLLRCCIMTGFIRCARFAYRREPNPKTPGSSREQPHPAMTTIRVKENEPFDVALRRFKRTIEKIGLLTELRAREFYEKPTAERKRKKAAAVKRHFKRVRSMQLPKKLY